ncbi:hypothetical protein [Haloplanus sp.]|uniref:hypothetical protein n=1 Tax=Haloplanus sp. TaxID=1961696 RepID=UPI002613FF20|nr:hypothetical protein [Haloplanus sp.]
MTPLERGSRSRASFDRKVSLIIDVPPAPAKSVPADRTSQVDRFRPSEDDEAFITQYT